VSRSACDSYYLVRETGGGDYGVSISGRAAEVGGRCTGPVGPALPLPLRMAMRTFTQCPQPARGLDGASQATIYTGDVWRERWTQGAGRGMGADSQKGCPGGVKDTQPRGVRLPPPPRKEMTSARPPCPPPWISPQLGPLSTTMIQRSWLPVPLPVSWL
jgi:hypothetical protein